MFEHSISFYLQPVATWEAVREKKNQFREAGQDLLDDIKEKKAKVRERMDAIIEVYHCVQICRRKNSII